MISYEQFVPDQAAEQAVCRALEKYREVWEYQGRYDDLPPVIAQGLAQPDPPYVYEHAATFCQDHFTMLWAAETDCVPLFRLRIEGLGDTSKLEFFVQVAGRLNSAQVIRYLLPYVGDINQQENDGPRGHAHTALHWAVIQRGEAAVCALLEHPAINLEVKDRHGTTALDLAVRGQKLAIARHLLDAGAQLDPELILIAAGSWDLAMVEFAIEHAPDINFYGKKGLTPLHAAVAWGHVEGAKKLLVAGADPTLPSRRKFKRLGKEYPRHATAAEYAEIEGTPALRALFG